MTGIYLAYTTPVDETLEKHASDGPVDLLVAYPMLDKFLKKKGNFNIGKLCIDSGAFSVHNSGKTIHVEDYIEAVSKVKADEIFGLDVIGDSKATRRNLEKMWACGIKAIPTYHYGSPIAELDWCCEHSEKIALGGVAKKRGKERIRFLSNSLKHVWPKKVHAFGCTSQDTLEVGPWHTVDSLSWALAPLAMGSWQGFTGKQMRVSARGKMDLWGEVLEFKKRSKFYAFKWRKQLAELESVK